MLFYSLALYSILRIVRTVKEGLGQTYPPAYGYCILFPSTWSCGFIAWAPFLPFVCRLPCSLRSKKHHPANGWDGSFISEERRVGKECVIPFRFGCCRYHL